MKLLITHEIHAVEVDGRFYNQEKAVIGYDALCNYRYAIRDVLVVGRCSKGDSVREGWLRLDGEGISIFPIPELDFNSPLKVLLLLPLVIKRGLEAIKSCDRYMVRLPGPTGVLVAFLLRLTGRRYAVEFVGDPIGMLQVNNNLVRYQRVYGLFNGTIYKYLLKKGYCVAYRSSFLRQRYPCESKEREWVFSGAQLSKEAIGGPRDAHWFKKCPFKIVFVGRVCEEKGVMHLLHAFNELRKLAKKSLQLHYIGEGPYLSKLTSEASRLEIEDLVYFHGRVPRGPQLFALLDQAHCFVLPTFLEGMPRSLIEAMARGVPCFASNIHAVAELLDADLLFPPQDSDAIVEKLSPVVSDAEKLANISWRCYEASKAHWPEALDAAKQGFWQDVVEGCK
jgi:glycosyltransferase involved in cell wall biosynthesis